MYVLQKRILHHAQEHKLSRQLSLSVLKAAPTVPTGLVTTNIPSCVGSSVWQVVARVVSHDNRRVMCQCMGDTHSTAVCVIVTITGV